MTSTPVLEAVDLVRRFGSLTAVDHVSLRIDPGETVGLIGPNGAGKTTAISMMAGLLRPDGGAVHVSGVPMASEPIRAKRHLGLVPAAERAPEAVAITFDRIAEDPRHRDVRIVSDRIESERAFGDWTMASLPAERDGTVLRERVSRFLHDAPDDVRTAFREAGL